MAARAEHTQSCPQHQPSPPPSSITPIPPGGG
jgi:hypothetical protein